MAKNPEETPFKPDFADHDSFLVKLPMAVKDIFKNKLSDRKKDMVGQIHFNKRTGETHCELDGETYKVSH
jgi:hypothetical protein